MRYAIIGSRFATMESCEPLEKYLNSVNDVTEIVTGGAYGADSFGMRYAYDHNIKLTVYRPNAMHNDSLCDWMRDNYPNANVIDTGVNYLRRNTLVINNSDIVVCPDFGNGTIDSINKALKQNKKVLAFGRYIPGSFVKRIPAGIIYMTNN